MKHITYSDKSVLVGDEISDLLIEYAAALSTDGSGDSVFVKAISSDGDEVEANFLLGPGAPLMSETAHTTLPEPDNDAASGYVLQKLRSLTANPPGRSLGDDAVSAELDDLDYDTPEHDGPGTRQA